MNQKDTVRGHWQAEPCGTRGQPTEDRRAFFASIAKERYEQEPYLQNFAQFSVGAGRRVLEIGVGAGTDFHQWVRHGARAVGLDLTQQAVVLTRERLGLEGRAARVLVGDAECLPFPDGHFDLVWSYGVLHHSPDTRTAVSEVWRVLRPGGVARIMIYHVHSWTALNVWLFNCGLHLTWNCSLRAALARYLESPGTKAYTRAEARDLFAAFSRVQIQTRLGPGDLLLMRPLSKYQGALARYAWGLYPRWFIRALGDQFGLAMLIEATKQAETSS